MVEFKNLNKGVIEFKNKYCDENTIISSLLSNKLAKYFVEPIIDVGAGMGDILLRSFPEKKITLLDKNDYSFFSIPENFVRVKKDFFLYDIKPGYYKTALFSHVLQFIDDDIGLLNSKIDSLNIKYLVLVINTQNNLLDEIIKILSKNNFEINPELDYTTFPSDKFKKIDQVEFTAMLRGPDFKVLAKQILYLMDLNPTTNSINLIEYFLVNKLNEPKIKINQDIRIFYNKNYIS